MAKQTINIGTVANDRSGDPLRTAFTKVNQNFTELYNKDATDFSGNYNDLTNKPNLSIYQLANTAFSGDYNDLDNKPTISNFTNGEDDLVLPGSLIFPDTTTQTTAFTLNPTLESIILNGLSRERIVEKQNAGVVTYDCSEASVFFHASPSVDWTVNLVNFGLDDDYSTTITIIIDQFDPGHHPSVLQIDGNTQTIRWHGGVEPTPSTFAIDIVSFKIFKLSGGAGYSVVGQLVGAVPEAGETTQPYLELTNTPLIVLPSVLGQSVSFSKSPNASNTDPIDTGLTLARGVNGGLFNIVSEEEYDDNLHISPIGTRWNADGWGDLSNIATRSYGSLRSVLNNAIGNNILAAELVMHDTINDKYYKFDFTSWTQNNAGGGFAYTRTLIENPNFFKKDDYATGNNAIDVFVADDGEGSGIAITRDVNQGIYNPFREEEWDSDVSPDGTLWNTDGWDKDDLSNVETRTYDNFDDAYNGNLGNNVPGTKAIMYIPDTDEYYAIHWLSWTQNAEGGGFSYLRYKIDTTKFNEEGIAFADGSVLKSAEGVGRVKLRSPGRRRIEEAYGYNEVSVTAVNTINLTTLAIRNGVDENRFWVDSSNTTIDDIIDDTEAAQIIDETSIQFSLDNSTWYTFSGSISTVNNEKGYGVTLPEGQLLNYDAGDTIYFRYDAGGVPVEWWSKDDLPGGAANFRGAVIDYHAFTGDSTWIGTIHIADDDGEEHIAHTEVQSGSDDGENDDLWHVISEGRIHYRRIDGAAKLLKVQWGAKVFYGSEYWD